MFALYGRRDFADMIKLMAMKWENYPDRPNVITGSFKSGRVSEGCNIVDSE